MSNDSPLDQWRRLALEHAGARGVEGLHDALDVLARSTARLRAADWNGDARRPTTPPPGAPDGGR